MTAYGVTAAGFVPKQFQQILLDYQNSWLANVSPTADLSATTPEGQILASIANNDAELWQVAQAAWNSYNRQSVFGAGLDNLGDITGVPRLGASFTQVLCTLTISAANAPYAPGTLIASVTGKPTLTFSNVNTVTAGMISSGTATGILFQATVIGPTGTINAGTLTVIATPVTGWTAVTNPAAQSQLGSNNELDGPYSVRQQQQIAANGACNPPATVAAFYALFATTYAAAGQQGPYSAKLYENTSLQQITIGTLVLPAKSFTVVVYDPLALVPATGPATASPTSGQGSIAATVWQNKPAGIQTVGGQTAIVADQYLGNQAVNWSIPSASALFISATISIYPGQVFASIVTAIQSALVAAAIAPTPSTGITPDGQLTPGQAVIGSQLTAVILSVPGVANVQALTFDFHASPSNTAPLVVSPLTVATIAQSTVATNVVISQGTYP